MSFKNLKDSFNDELVLHLERHIPRDILAAAYKYALLPPGKLFRPNLAIAIFSDNKKEELKTDNIFNFARSLEFHHVYSLIHDDLPSMDNDDMRRGKPSLHIKFHEWQALLAGDGFINLSYRSLSKVDHPELPLLLKLYSWCLGPRGLIHGQAMDLSLQMASSFKNLRKTHILKTGRLLQLSLLGGYILSSKDKTTSPKALKDIFRLGESLGLIFQYLDDLTELTEANLSIHEKQINPWVNSFRTELETDLKLQIERIRTNQFYKNGPALKEMLVEYFDKIISILTSGEEVIKKRDLQITPVVSLLNSLR